MNVNYLQKDYPPASAISDPTRMGVEEELKSFVSKLCISFCFRYDSENYP